MQLDDKRMGYLLHNISLYLDLRSLIMLSNEIFLQGLYCIYLTISLALCHVHFAKVATSHDFQKIKVLYLHSRISTGGSPRIKLLIERHEGGTRHLIVSLIC